MAVSKRFPVKTLLTSAGLSASLALLGCATNGVSSLSHVLPVAGNQQPTGSTAAQQPVTGSAQQTAETVRPYRYDWSSDRVFNGNSGEFRTASFVDSLKPSLELPPVARQAKDAATSGGLTNAFAKNLPGADTLPYVPGAPPSIGSDEAGSVPASFGDTTYFLTGSGSSTNAFALASNGQVQWELGLHDNGKFDGTSVAGGQAANVNTLYAITDKGRLYAINATTGVVISFVEIPTDEFHKVSPFVVTQGITGGGSSLVDRVFLTSDKGRLYRYTFNGSTFSQDYNVKPVTSSNTGRFSSSAVVTVNNQGTADLSDDTIKHVYAGSEEGKLYKFDPATGAVNGTPLELNAGLRSGGCQIMATMVVDLPGDVGIVPCGSYLFKIRLSDNSNSNLGLAAQSPLLELRQLTTLTPMRVLGPNFVKRPQFETSILREPLPLKDSFKLEQPFGFQKGDFVRVQSTTLGNLYGEISTLSDAGLVTIKNTGLFPIASPSPDPILFGGEKVSLANNVVRPVAIPEGVTATPYPTPTPPPAGSDPVTRFQIGANDNLAEGDLIRFPTLPGAPVVPICSSTTAGCNLGTSGAKFPGIQRFVPGTSEERAVLIVTVPGVGLQTLIDNEMAATRFVPFEKVTNQVFGTTNAALSFEMANIKDFKAGDTIRVTHQNGSANGRFEFGQISSVNTATRRITLLSPLASVPATGDTVEQVTPNDRVFGRVTSSLLTSNGNIISEPVLRGNGQEVYVQHGNSVFELNYASDSSFRDSANYLILQSGRLDASNRALTAQSRSRPLIVNSNKLMTVDTDPSGKTGIFLNRVLLPLSSTGDRLNDLFPVLEPNSLGQLSNRAETRPVLLSTTNFVMFGGGNGVAYKLHKDNAW